MTALATSSGRPSRLVRELKPLQVLTTAQQLSEVLAGIVGSLFPDDVKRSWHFFGTNTLQRYLLFLATAYTPPLPDYATIGMFATLYQRVCELRVGKRFLDAGCGSGFLPLLIAERIPFLDEIVGIDSQEVFIPAKEIATERGFANVRFAQIDIVADDLRSLGCFDTITALHVIEHLAEAEMYRALTHLFELATQRLIIAVPYEREPETAYGHKQVFSREKLEALGQWCLRQFPQAGRMWCEDCVGGLLLIEKSVSQG